MVGGEGVEIAEGWHAYLRHCAGKNQSEISNILLGVFSGVVAHAVGHQEFTY